MKLRIRAALAVAVAAVLAFAAVPAHAVTNGKTATAGQFPYQVSIRIDGEHNCGGALLNAYTVLTAAHCVPYSFPGRTTVGYGGLDRTKLTVVGVSKIIKHPNYDPRTFNNDIAIVKVSSPIPVGSNANVAAIALPPQGAPDPTGAVVVAGWGRTVGSSEELPTALQYAVIGAQARNSCVAWWARNMLLTPNMICAGLGNVPVIGPCHGDSGGPLAQGGVVVGLVSFGRPGCPADNPYFPVVFTKVANYRYWINQYMGPSVASSATSTTSAAAAASTTSAAPNDEPIPDGDHGCPSDSICGYTTVDDYTNDNPAVVDDLMAMPVGDVMSIPTERFAEIVNNTENLDPYYASEGAIVADVFGECVFVPEGTQAPGVDTTAEEPLAVNAIAVGTDAASVDRTIVPCPI